jgi:nucleoid-associated protein YgaU
LINGGAPLGSVAQIPAGSAVPNIAVQPRGQNVAPPAAPQPKFHLVAEGDSLTRISVRYYGTSSRWQEIYDANRDSLKGENALRPGQRLRIP